MVKFTHTQQIIRVEVSAKAQNCNCFCTLRELGVKCLCKASQGVGKDLATF